METPLPTCIAGAFQSPFCGVPPSFLAIIFMPPQCELWGPCLEEAEE